MKHTKTEAISLLEKVKDPDYDSSFPFGEVRDILENTKLTKEQMAEAVKLAHNEATPNGGYYWNASGSKAAIAYLKSLQ